jgi:tRNA pseudouridine65 synthase
MKVLYDDPYMVAVRKKEGWLVHPTFVSREKRNVLHHVQKMLGYNLHTVHRLDRATSGVLLFAKTREMAAQLSQLFSTQKVTKIYLALVRGHLPPEGRIERYLKIPRNYKLESYVDDETRAQWKADERCQNIKSKGDDNKNSTHITDYETLATAEIPHAIGRYATARYSLVRAFPRTGRLHQIRRHFAGMGHPIIGDKTHGDRDHNRFFVEQWKIDRMLLHCLEMRFLHPVLGSNVHIWCTPGWGFRRAVELAFNPTDVLKLTGVQNNDMDEL